VLLRTAVIFVFVRGVTRTVAFRRVLDPGSRRRHILPDLHHRSGVARVGGYQDCRGSLPTYETPMPETERVAELVGNDDGAMVGVRDVALMTISPFSSS